MEYFDVHEIPKGYLRARFRTASEAESRQLAAAFAPLFGALILKETGEQKTRMGFGGAEKVGKSSFASSLIDEGIIPETTEKFLSEDSEHYRMMGGQWISHYDARAVASWKSRGFSVQNEIAAHAKHIKDAIAHLVEYPEMDDETVLSVLWDFRSDKGFLDRIEDSDREIDLFCTDEITEMPEYQQFLEDSAPFMIK